MARADGGQAFPSYTGGGSVMGMTLRDWFAGQALAALSGLNNSGTSFLWDSDQLAKRAYARADAMLAERAKMKAEVP
jgi:hypothetical protein